MSIGPLPPAPPSRTRAKPLRTVIGNSRLRRSARPWAIASPRRGATSRAPAPKGRGRFPHRGPRVPSARAGPPATARSPQSKLEIKGLGAGGEIPDQNPDVHPVFLKHLAARGLGFARLRGRGGNPLETPA